jgi:LysR family glycine cleavage system transcriptional activator
MLFKRSGHNVSITPLGSVYLQNIRACLDEIEASTTDLKAGQQDDVVISLIIPPVFGSRWLVPHLPKFTAQHPRIDFQISLEANAIDFGGISFSDAAISFGASPPASIEWEWLTPGHLAFVCRPELIEKPLPSFSFAQVEGLRLLELGVVPSWERFVRQDRNTGFNPKSVRRYEYFEAGIQSAIAGEGVLLAPPFLILDSIRSGALVSPWREILKVDMAYYFCFPRQKRRRKSIALFCQWLVEELANTDAAAEEAMEAQRRRLFS